MLKHGLLFEHFIKVQIFLNVSISDKHLSNNAIDLGTVHDLSTC